MPNLKVGIVISAIDRATKPLRALSGAAGATGKALTKMGDQSAASHKLDRLASAANGSRRASGGLGRELSAEARGTLRSSSSRASDSRFVATQASRSSLLSCRSLARFRSCADPSHELFSRQGSKASVGSFEGKAVARMSARRAAVLLRAASVDALDWPSPRSKRAKLSSAARCLPSPPQPCLDSRESLPQLSRRAANLDGRAAEPVLRADLDRYRIAGDPASDTMWHARAAQ